MHLWKIIKNALDCFLVLLVFLKTSKNQALFGNILDLKNFIKKFVSFANFYMLSSIC